MTSLTLPSRFFALLVVLGALSGCHRRESRAPRLDFETDADRVCVGAGHTCVLTAEGEVLCSGRNLDGQLGDGTFADHGRPVAASGLRGATRIACGATHTCAVAGGALHCWGRNDRGQLGTGDRENRATPTRVAGLASVVEVAAGSDFTCASTVDGQVHCVGAHDEGRLGVARADDATSPVVVRGVTQTVSVAAGRGHACALSNEGRVRCWGDGTSGQLGDGRSVSRAAPGSVPGISRATSLAAGGDTTCVVAAQKRVRCFGKGDVGQVGNDHAGPGYQSARPVTLERLGPAATVAVGAASACARLESGNVACWGDGRRGELARGGFEMFPRPVEAVGATSASAIAVGDGTACIVRQNGALACWGSNAYGGFGNASTQPGAVALDVIANVDHAVRDEPRPQLGPAMPVGRTNPAIALGDAHVCAVLSNGTIRCTGNPGDGRLGHGSTALPDGVDAVTVRGVDDAVEIAAQAATTCVRRASGRVACWGRSEGSLGYPTVRSSSVPVEVLGIVDATSIAVGRGFACMVRGAGEVACLGENGFGQLGVGTNMPSEGTLSVRGLTDAIDVAAGRGFACALRRSGQVSCWGDGGLGQLGNGTADGSTTPVDVVGLRDAVGLAAFDSDVCAVRRSGKLACWGRTAAGAYTEPTPTAPFMARPMDVPGIVDAAVVSVGSGFACVELRDTSVRCFGQNSAGQAGAPPAEHYVVTEPIGVQAAADNPVTSVATGQEAACSVRQMGEVSCWGGGPALARAAAFVGAATSSPTSVPMRGFRL